MLFALFYVLAITILIMHFTGFLARHNLEWLVLVLAAAVFPAVIYLRKGSVRHDVRPVFVASCRPACSPQMLAISEHVVL